MRGQEFKISTLFKNNIQNPENVDFIEVRGFARNFHVKFCNNIKIGLKFQNVRSKNLEQGGQTK